MEDVAEEEGCDSVSWLLRLEEIMLLHLNAAGQSRVFLAKDASAFIEHLLAILHAEREMREAARQRH
jgi:hypothetical protein